ncbi:6-carboxytetrahydropterin synthase [Chloroflexus sp.]|uniref:6-pyruvoyl trahydropterin synthase family protein n=1 Tax=Chloroflexus sp. TaxID=1904827 RepID=UPI00298F2D86|nr:6-carboxytetrahydropterin synthase [Chloroflexus sp.]MCS6887430.1 6-carboxytetrahydropterin synthase [Chloroflexus sp.]MDW8405489.1 6-carboxytetrahydropterin synthase [Chloroflexus sp.]
MYEIGVNAQFEAAHRLEGNFGPATRMHGHTYRLEAIVTGDRLHADGTLFDITRLHEAVNAIVADLHYRDLGTVEGLREVNTTAEHVARYCWDRIAAALRGAGLATLTVRIWENPQAYAAYSGTLE